MDPDRIKIENIANTSRKVFLIAGTINATGKTLFWKDRNDMALSVGEYVIVENMNGYDLIKIVGIVETTEKEARKFSNTEYDRMKKVVLNIGSID